MSSQGGIQFKEEYEIAVKEPELAYPIPESQLSRIIERLERANDKSKIYHSSFWTLIGICVTSFLSAILLPYSIENIPLIVQFICWGFVVTSAIVAIFTFHYSKTHKSDREEIRKHVIEDLKDVRNKYKR